MKQVLKNLVVPEGYRPKLSIRETEIGIKKLKDFFEQELATELNLTRVSAPLFVNPVTGLNDNLNGVERPVSFEVKGINDTKCEIVQSLAKWKRMALRKYGFKTGEGLYTDMNAIRRDEELDNLHSIYVDQWDWERVISKEDRKTDTLKMIVRKIYKVFKETEKYVHTLYPDIKTSLPDEIAFITSQELEDAYPELTPKERENFVAKKTGAVFIMQIGKVLKSGKKHDGRAPDYDDWSLNGDIFFWNPLLESAFELSSMGIRVDETSLLEQLKHEGCEERAALTFHRGILTKELPYTIGGGIGQSRLCMFFLQKAHVGEVQSSVWPDEMVNECAAANIQLL